MKNRGCGTLYILRIGSVLEKSEIVVCLPVAAVCAIPKSKFTRVECTDSIFMHLGLCALPTLVVPLIHTELTHRAFSVAAPSTWNSTCRHSTVRKHSHIQTPLENPSIQTPLVLCCIKCLRIFGPKGAIQIRYYYYY